MKLMRLLLLVGSCHGVAGVVQTRGLSAVFSIALDFPPVCVLFIQ